MSGPQFTQAQLLQLKGFIELCKTDTTLLNHPDLAFFKSFIESFGGRVPTNVSKPKTPEARPPPTTGPTSAPEPEPVESEESEESDVELDMSGVIEGDDDAPQSMGNTKVEEVSEEAMEKANDLKSQAIAAANDGDTEKAISLYTEAIQANPLSALQYAKRGQCYLKLARPNACIRDCSRALEINPDNAAAYKFRGRARRLLGHWEQAAADLGNACKIDYDEQADEWLREVTPNAKKLLEHRRKYERKNEERALKEKLARSRRAREEHLKARQAAQDAAPPPGATPPGGAAPDMSDFYKFLNDPDITAAFQDPEVAAAFQDITANPANIIKYQNNPKVSALINKMASSFGGGLPGGLGGMGGMGGMPGGFGGFGGMGGFPPGAGGDTPDAPPSATPRTPGDDVGLD